MVLVLLSQNIEGYSLAKHMDIDKFEHSCPELDNCSYENETKLLSPNIERSCACDVECNKFEDCCIDAPKLKTVKSDMKCYDVKGLGGVYMIGECPATYDGDESWREMCENLEIADSSDPIGSVPVTDSDTGVTYKNVYCQFCNGKFNFTLFWQAKVDCPFLSYFNDSYSITDEYVMKNLVKKDESWGLNLKTIDGMFFLECNIETVMQPDLRSKIRQCNPNLISDCPSTWEDEVIRKKCKSFQGARYTDDGIGYRNTHCAICNNVNAAELSCISPQAESIKLFRFNLAHSFAVLLDVNTKKGERVGMIRLCKSGDVFDPFFKKCRELQCLPGFVRRGRRCYPKRSVSKLVVSSKTIRKPTKYRRVYTSTSKPYSTTNDDISTIREATSLKTNSYTKERNTSYYETSYISSLVAKALTNTYDFPDAPIIESNYNK